MNIPETNKSKALRDSVGQVAYDASGGIVDGLVASYPQAGIPLKLIHATFGLRLAYKQEEINQFVQHLMDNQDTFTKELFESKDFQDGMTVFLDDYLKLRGGEKLEIARGIFSDFAKSSNMPLYPIEMYDDTLAKISQAGIRFLGLLKNELIPQRDNYPLSGEAGYASLRRVPLSTVIDRYLQDNPERRDELKLLVDEASRLGLIDKDVRPAGMLIDTDSIDKFDLSHYGEMFISVIKPLE